MVLLGCIKSSVGIVVAQFIGLTGVIYSHIQNEVMNLFSVSPINWADHHLNPVFDTTSSDLA
jgi:hypothetical protein